MEEGVGGLEAYHLGREAVEEFGGVVAVVFGKACDGDFEVQLVLDYLSCHFHLSGTAIDNQQLG